MSYGNKERLSEKLQVVKRNPLNSAKIQTSTLEYKLLLAALSKISPESNVLEEIVFKVEDFCKLIDFERKEIGGMYTYLKKACDRLLSRTVTIDTEDGWKVFSWMDYIEYVKKSGEIRIKFHRFLEPFIIFWLENKGYTKYLLENVIHMDSKYSIRIYELLKQYESAGSRIILVKELRELLGIDKSKYSKFNDFKRYVINQAFKEVNEKTDIAFSFEEMKEGRKITAIKFYIKSKKVNESDSMEALPKDQLVKLLQLEIKNRYVIVFEIEILMRYHRKILLELLLKLKRGEFDKTPVRSPFGFFKWQLDEITDMFDVSQIKDY